MNKEATSVIIIEESDEDVFEIPEVPMNRAIQGMEEDEEQSIVEDDGNNIIVTHERTLKRPRKRVKNQNKKQYINMGWIKNRLSNHAYESKHTQHCSTLHESHQQFYLGFHFFLEMKRN